MSEGAVPNKICILRLSALGDVTHVVPVLRAVQRAWPHTEISWVCGAAEYPILAAIDGVRFVVFDKKTGWRAYRELKRALDDKRFDVLLHMQVAARANLASLCIRADMRLGWDRARSRDLHGLFVDQRVASATRQHQVQAFLSFARALGLAADDPRWDLPVSAQGREFAEQVLPGDQPTLLISPCSRHALRDWSADRYAAVADYAIEKLRLRVVLSGGRSEREASMGAAIAGSMNNAPLNLIGKDTLAQALALLQRAAVVLAPDSGPVHIANALGTPVIGLYACTWSKRSGPYRSLHLCADKFAEAARRYRRANPEDLRWGTRIEKRGVMQLIQVEDVIERLELALQQRRE